MVCKGCTRALLFFVKYRTAYGVRISDASSDVCASDLQDPTESRAAAEQFRRNSHRENATDPQFKAAQSHVLAASIEAKTRFPKKEDQARYIENAKETVAKRIENGGPIPAARFEQQRQNEATRIAREDLTLRQQRSEEHTSELQSLMRISYAVFCLKTK